MIAHVCLLAKLCRSLSPCPALGCLCSRYIFSRLSLPQRHQFSNKLFDQVCKYAVIQVWGLQHALCDMAK